MPPPAIDWTDDPSAPDSLFQPRRPAGAGHGFRRLVIGVAVFGLGLGALAFVPRDTLGLPLALGAVVAVLALTFGAFAALDTGRRARRLIAQRAPEREIQSHAAPAHGDLLWLPLAPPPQMPSPLDPDDAHDREAARVIHRCRTRDGLGFLGYGTDALLVSLHDAGQPPTPLAERVDDWLAVARFLDHRTAREATWLAALALADPADPRALDALAHVPDGPALRARVRARLAADHSGENANG